MAWKNENFINADAATIVQRLYQIKAEQDGRDDVTVIARAVPRKDESDSKEKAV